MTMLRGASRHNLGLAGLVLLHLERRMTCLQNSLTAGTWHSNAINRQAEVMHSVP